MPSFNKLPIGIQAFDVLRQHEFTYVDKTQSIFRLVDRGMFYFLARPRRFGKSLLVSTLRCLFEARRELFDSLWIAEHSDWPWEAYPVLVLDFNEISHRTPAELEYGLLQRLNTLAQIHGIQFNTELLPECFQTLILQLYQKTSKPVVVLIDEYDKPIIDHLGLGTEHWEVAKANRDLMKYFLGTLKGTEVSSCLRFVFLTGISRFSRVSLFSELNNLNDISMQGHYATLCGYTEDELNHYFSDYLKVFQNQFEESPESLMAQLASQYNGYRFSKESSTVYNPFSLLKAFDALDFEDYWFETGSPSFLINLLKGQAFDLPQIEHLELEADSFSTYDLENLDPVALLFQTGYTTIKAFADGIYTLGYPNQEVKKAFLKFLFRAYTHIPNQKKAIQKLIPLLEQEDYERFFGVIQATFAEIPYVLNTQQGEAYFHTVFYLIMVASGGSVRNEVLTSQGRIDMLVEFSDKVVIIEFKCNQSAKAALKQIHQKNYAAPFRQQGKTIVLLGINFSTETRNIAEWLQEK